jgi:curved DNA-binding protein CbpA
MAQPYSDPYAALGLTREATAAEIKQAYFALVRSFPPEREPERFKQIRAAYERLRDPEQRREADMLLIQPWSSGARRRRPPALDLRLEPFDVILAARTLTDLERGDWREHFKKVEL